MKTAKIIIPVLVAAVAAGLVVNRGLSKTRTLTIQQASGVLDSRIIALQGRLYPQGDNRFILTDGTGNVEVETCPLWYRRILLEEGEDAVVIGERLPDRPKIEGCVFVMSVFTIEGSRSGTITIREQLGKPPWALQTFSSESIQFTYPQGLVDN